MASRMNAFTSSGTKRTARPKGGAPMSDDESARRIAATTDQTRDDVNRTIRQLRTLDLLRSGLR
jgi:hypothetical protein